jgi:GTPase
VDGEQGVTQGDAQIASYAEESGRSVIIVMNKWDLATEAARQASERDAGTTRGKDRKSAKDKRAAASTRPGKAAGGAVVGATAGKHAFSELDKSRLLYDYEEMVRGKLKFLSYAPIVFLSAKTGDRAAKLFPLIDLVAAARKKKISTPELNRWLKEDVDLQRGTTPKARPVRIYYMTQAKTAPPTFLIFTNQKEPLHFSYERFLENQLRKKWDFPGAPIRFVQRLRKREPRPGAPKDEDD